ncbi:metalloregulator ArsR/SmtB family transcription factor [Aestuariivirga sp.]|uniref:ArsR/SmtB family transcription factor n=1 Tax=Aestuariivirga sp. TaxID=2650926 RepID=UPI0025BEB241|nr:metalloregulator ArsR/SmtB family transcription factor [Aestuariivirga sp.]MCA3555045.1 helix-turn-helix transcriptional regulator [Aestuariivirga sp.]
MSILDLARVTGKERKLVLAKVPRATAILKSLSHEARLLILCLLCDGEKPVSKIEELMGMPQAAVSQQLARLRRAGLVSTRREGRSIFYSIASEDASRLISTLHDMLGGENRPMPRSRA